MRTPSLPQFLIVAGLVLLAPAARLSAEVEVIMAPGKRTEALERARQLLAPKQTPAQSANPFFSDAFEGVRTGMANRAIEESSASATAANPATPAPVKGDRALLQSIAASLKPSGYFVLGGQPTLVFGQKRVKAGGLLTITFEGKEYTLEVTALDRTNFTLRLNREEFTRPIK